MGNLEEKIKAILGKLTKLLLDKMIAEDIDEEEGAEIARYILNEKRKVVDEASFKNFLENVAKEYPIFSSVIEEFQKEEKLNDKDQQKLIEIKSQLSKFITQENE